MPECEHFRDKIWEDLYGLLSDEETHLLNDHLAECMECREIRADFVAQQESLANAALAVRGIPEFEPPQEQPIAEKSLPSSMRPSEQQPQQAEQKSRRPLRPFRWVMAAVVLVVASCGALFAWYQYEFNLKRVALSAARDEFHAIDAQFVQLRQKVKHQLADPPHEFRERFPQLVVSGPTHFHPHSDNTVRVQTRDVLRNAVESQVEASFVEEKSGRTLYRKKLQSNGDTFFNIPKTLKPQEDVGELVVKAKHTNGGVDTAEPFAEVRQTIRLDKRYVTQIIVNKPTFHGSDMVFFRTLTLDQLNLRPPVTKIPLNFSLQRADGQAVKHLTGEAQPNGVAGGAFAVTDDLPDGNYQLEVTGVRGITNQSYPIEIQRDQPAAVFLEAEQIQPGKNFIAAFRSRRQSGALVPHQPLTVTLKDAAGMVAARPVQVCTDANGWACTKLALPKKYRDENAQLEIEIAGESQKSKLVRTVPVANADLHVDFYPEGGRLIAGVPNRVYFQVRTKDGRPVQPEGHVIILSSDEVILDTPRGQRAGVFTMTPEIGETYTLRLTSSRGVQEIPDPFRDHPVLPQGVVLSVREAVTQATEPVEVVLHNSGADAELLLTATCRDYVVGRKEIQLGRGSKTIPLPLDKDVKGVVQLTLFKDEFDTLKPIAERLVFRRPAENLSLSVATEKTKPTAQKPVTLRLQAQAQGGAETPIWFSAVVVDELALSPNRDDAVSPSHPLLHFNHADGVAALGDISHLGLMEDQQSLELALGIGGWRRLVTDVPAGDDHVSEKAAFFRKRSASSPALENKIRPEVVQSANAERTKLIERRDRAMQSIESAEAALAKLEAQPQHFLRTLFGIAVVGLLIAGALFLIGGFWRLIWRRREPRPLLLTSLAMLFLCFLLYAAFGSGGAPVNPENTEVVEKRAAIWPEFTHKPAPNVEPNEALHAGIYVSREFARRKPASVGYAQQDASLPQVTVHLPNSGGAGNAQFYFANSGSLQSQTWKSPQWLKRFASTQMAQELFTRNSTTYLPTPTNMEKTSKKGAPIVANGIGGYFQETLAAPYIHQSTSSGLDFQDTVFWHPKITATRGRAQVSFDVPNRETTYRILLFAHDAQGRMGFHQARLTVRLDQ